MTREDNDDDDVNNNNNLNTVMSFVVYRTIVTLLRKGIAEKTTKFSSRLPHSLKLGSLNRGQN